MEIVKIGNREFVKDANGGLTEITPAPVATKGKGKVKAAAQTFVPRVEDHPKYGPMLELIEGRFKFGPGKARAIVANLETVKAFAAKYEPKSAN
jgi:hypothetical protein